MRLERNTDSNTLWVTKITVQRWRCHSAQQILVEPEARDLVERGERLVEQQELRLGDERARDRDAHLHPARQLARIDLGERHRARPRRASPRSSPRPRRARRPSAAAADRHCPRPSPTASASAPGRRSRYAPCRRRLSAMRPSLGAASPAMRRSSVLLPQPDGPKQAEERALRDAEIDAVERHRAVAEDSCRRLRPSTSGDADASARRVWRTAL